MAVIVRGHLLTDCGDCCNDLAEFQFVKNCSFSSCIQPDHKNTHLLLPQQGGQQSFDIITHLGCFLTILQNQRHSGTNVDHFSQYKGE